MPIFLPINAPSTRHVVDMASADDGKCASLRLSSFFNAAHEYEPAMRDVRAYWELLEPGGYLVGDDYVAVWPDVIRVAHEFAQSVNQPLTVAEPKWILQKPQ